MTFIKESISKFCMQCGHAKLSATHVKGIEIAHNEQISHVFSNNQGEIDAVLNWTEWAWWDVDLDDEEQLLHRVMLIPWH